MKNQEKLVKTTRADVRKSIIQNGVWNGVVLYQGELSQDRYYHPDDRQSRFVYATYTNIANINDPNLLEFYNLS